MIEILIVVVILSLVAGLSYPSIRNTMDEQALNGATGDVLDALQFGFMQAQARGRSQVLRITPSSGAPGGRVEFLETAGWGCGDATSRGVEDLVLPGADAAGVVAITEIAPAVVAEEGLCFKPNGRVYSTSGAVPLMDGAQQDAYNSPRASTVGVRLRRFSNSTGIPVGVRREIHVIHAGTAGINQELAPL